MAFEKVMKYLEERGFTDRVQTFSVSTATVELERLSGAVSWVDVCVELAPANEQKG